MNSIPSQTNLLIIDYSDTGAAAATSRTHRKGSIWVGVFRVYVIVEGVKFVGNCLGGKWRRMAVNMKSDIN